MPSDHVRVLHTPDDVAAAAADALLAAVRSTPPERPFTLAISGGDTPRRLFRLLTADAFRETIRTRVHFFWADERLVPSDADESNYGTAQRLLLSPAGVPAGHVHRVRTEVGAADDVAADYENELRRHFAGIGGASAAPAASSESAAQQADMRGRANDPPRFDAVLLGLGADGHTASLFPGSPALREHQRWVSVTRLPSVTPERVTLTYPVLNNAARVLFLVTGRSKRDILQRILDRSGPTQYPAQRIQPVDGTLLWLVDADASR